MTIPVVCSAARTNPAGPVTRNDFAAIARTYRDAALTEPARLEELAGQLGVSVDSLRQLWVGWDGQAQCWTIPERDPDGEIIGIATRDRQGKKRCVVGSRRGLTMPWPWDEYLTQGSGPLILVVEGMSDTAVGLHLEFLTFGRPMAHGGVEMLRDSLRGMRVVVIGENDAGAGRTGAEKIAGGLLGVAASVKILYPPKGIKDLREWVVSDGCTRKTLQGLIDQAEPLTNEDPQSDVSPNDTLAWGPPTPLTASLQPPVFPLQEAFPSTLAPIRDYLAAVADALQVPVDLPAMLLLPVVAVAMAQKAEIQLAPDWREPAALWTMTLLESGNRKSAAMAKLIKPLQAWERGENDRWAPMIAEQRERRRIDEKRLAELRGQAARSGDDGTEQDALALARRIDQEQEIAVPQLTTMEPTSEAVAGLLVRNGERLLVASAEADALDVMLGRYSRGAANFGIWLCGHAGDTYRIDRQGREPDHLNRPTLSVALAVQPESIRDLFQHRQAHSRGLVARFLLSAPQSLLGRRKIDAPPIPDHLSQTYSQAITRLLDQPINDHPTLVTLDGPSAAIFRQFRERIERELGPHGALGDRTEWGGKLCGAVARIALVFHGLDQWGICANSANSANCARYISHKTMMAALAWAPYLIDHELAAHQTIGCDAVTTNAQRILRWLEQAGVTEFSKRQAFTECRSNHLKKTADIDPALSLLVETGHIRLTPPTDPTHRGRKPSPTYAVNPYWKAGQTR